MVKVEPFFYQKMTAFRERIQMVDKINEMIDVLNNIGIDPEEVRAIITEELSNYYDKAEIDEMFENIDFSPYYTKTEVNTIVERIDGDVDAVEGRMGTAETDIVNLKGRMDTAEGDIDNLETNKQNNLTVGQGLSLANDKIDLSGWEVVPLADWSNLFDTVSTNVLRAKEELVMQYSVASAVQGFMFFPKGMVVKDIYLYPEITIASSDISTKWYRIASTSNIVNSSASQVGLNDKRFGISKASGNYECRITVQADSSSVGLTKIQTDGPMTASQIRFFRRV